MAASPDMEGQGHNLSQRSGDRRGALRWSWRIPAQWTSSTHLKPSINTINMETVMTIWKTPYGILGLVIGQAYGAWTVIGFGESPAFTQHHLRIRVYNGLSKTHHHRHWLYWIAGSEVPAMPIAVAAVTTATIIIAATAITITFNPCASIRSEHYSGNEDENANGNGDTITKATARSGRR